MSSPVTPQSHKHSTTSVELSQRMADNLTAIGRDRDRAAFYEVYEYFAGRVKSFLMGKGMSDEIAEELMQEIMLTVWRRAESYKPSKAAASTWIFTITRNRRIDYLRGNSRIEVELDEQILEANNDDADLQQKFVDDTQAATKLHRALSKLPPEQQQVMQLSYFRGQSHSTIAQWLNLPVGTVKSRIRLAMRSVKKSLNSEEDALRAKSNESN